MEWEATTATATAALTKKEPRWASREEVERRKQEGLCLRCGKDGHMVRDCQARLGKAKKEKTYVAMAKKTKKRRDKVNAEETSSESESSGKE